MVGSFWAVLVINLVLASGSLALGTLLSAFARNEFQLFQFIPIVIVPQIMFSGIFDLRNARTWAKILSKIFPMTYGAEALRDVMLRGKTLIDVKYDLLVLIGYALLFLILNTLALKKYRKI
jgi:ABC-2 type transport system permease protein